MTFNIEYLQKFIITRVENVAAPQQLGVTRSQAMASVSKSTLGHGHGVKVDFWPWPQIHFDTEAMARTPL